MSSKEEKLTSKEDKLSKYLHSILQYLNNSSAVHIVICPGMNNEVNDGNRFAIKKTFTRGS